jgi:DNA-binding NarL/FixJ family response regulator
VWENRGDQVGTDCGKVLIADADERLRATLLTLFQRTGFRTTEARSGAEALASVRRQRPALILLDVQLPGVSGYAVCHELREQYGRDLPIVFLSGTRTESSDRVAGLLLGADDYIVKPFDPDELLARVRRLITRAEDGNRRPDDARLTKRERQVLNLLASGVQQNEIAERLVISPTTVATHIQRILPKLGVHSRAEAVARAHRDGLVGDVGGKSVVEVTPAQVTT